jgi:hypothetical protein
MANFIPLLKASLIPLSGLLIHLIKDDSKFFIIYIVLSELQPSIILNSKFK